MILVDWGMLSVANMFSHIKNKNDISLDFLRHMILNSLRKINVKHKDEYGQLVIACDDKLSWRKEFFPYYKANRKKARDDSGLDWPTIYSYFATIRDELKENMPYRVIHVEKAEADDIIAVLATLTQFTSNKEDVLIVSRDHDFKQLQKYDNVKQWNFIDNEYINVDDEQTAIEYLFSHIAKGDSGDGVPNVLSEDNCLVIGKRQKPMTSKRLAEFGSLVGQINTTDENILRNWERNKKMIDFSEIPQEIRSVILAEYRNQEDKDSSKMFNYFLESKLKHHLENINDF